MPILSYKHQTLIISSSHRSIWCRVQTLLSKKKKKRKEKKKRATFYCSVSRVKKILGPGAGYYYRILCNKGGNSDPWIVCITFCSLTYLHMLTVTMTVACTVSTDCPLSVCSRKERSEMRVYIKSVALVLVLFIVLLLLHGHLRSHGDGPTKGWNSASQRRWGWSKKFVRFLTCSDQPRGWWKLV